MNVPAGTALTLSSLVVRAIRRHGDALAVRHEDRTLSYRALDQQSDALARALAAAGVRRGERVALLLRNCPEYAVSDIALLKLGAVKVPLNEMMSPAEAAHCLAHSGAAAIIGQTSLLASLVLTAPLIPIAVPDGPAAPARSLIWSEVCATDAPAGDWDGSEPDGEDTVAIMYTGGTTGHPKGVRHLQGRMAINLLSHIVCGEIRPGDVMLLTTPLPHSAGLFMQAGFVQGCEVVLETRFNPARFVEICTRARVGWTFMVPTMLYRVLDLPAASVAYPALHTIVYGAAPINRERLAAALEVFGPIFIQLYGQTECPNFITTLRKADHRDAALLASCGTAVPFTRVRVKSDSGDAGPGEVGEIQVTSPYLLADYYNDPAQTAAAFDAGWLKTGDLGYLDRDERLFLVDRAKDMIISGGMNVYSIEIEIQLRTVTGVKDVAVVGLPDHDWGEAVTAVVVGDPALTSEGLRAACKSALTGYKVPKHFVFRDDLPLTRYGKVDKKVLKQALLESRKDSRG